MTDEIRELRVRWQNHRQALLRADHNQADEELARTLYFAENTPIIAGILRQVRSIPLYDEFDAEEWLIGRGPAGAMGAGRTNIGFSLDDTERAVQCLKVLELAARRFTEGQYALFAIGQTSYGGRSAKMIAYVRSAIKTVFEPFYHYLDAELRAQGTLIKPTVEGPILRGKTIGSDYSLHVFVATPRDVAAERDRLGMIVRDLGAAFTAHRLTLKLLDWRDVVPDLGRPEDVILDQLPVEKWDIFIGVLWARFGTPPGRKDPETGKLFLSGTEEEFTLACRSWRETGKPRVLFYRCKRPVPVDWLEPEQIALVQEFFKEFEAGGEYPGLYQEYETVDDFERRVRQDLLKLLLEYSRGEEKARLESEVGEEVRKLEEEQQEQEAGEERAAEREEAQIPLMPPTPELKLPPDPDTLYTEALELFYTGQYAEAIPVLEAVLKAQPSYPGGGEKLEIARQVTVLENEARLLRQAGRWKDVQAVLERIQALMPEYSDIHGYRAWAEGECRRDMPNLLYRQGLESLHPQEQQELAHVNGAHGLHHLAGELANSGRWETLHRLVAEGDDRQPWAEAQCGLNGNYTGYLTDLRLAWRHAEELGLEQARCGEPITAIGKQVRYGAIASSIYFVLSGEVPRKDRERDRALFLTVNSLAALGPSLSARPDLLTWALDVTSSIGNVAYRSDALAALSPSLTGHPDLLTRALDAARSIGDSERRSKVLVALAAALGGHPDLLAQALDTAGSIGDRIGYHDDARPKALVALVPHLSDDLRRQVLTQALDIVRSISYEQARSESLVALVPHLPDTLRQEALAEALDAVRSIRDGTGGHQGGSRYSRSKAITALAPLLAGQTDLLIQALDVARSIGYSHARFMALAALAPHLLDDLRQEILAEALDAIRSISDRTGGFLSGGIRYERSEAVAALAPALAGQTALLIQALDAARSIGYGYARSQALAALAPHLPDDLRREAVTEALDAARNTSNGNSRAQALAALVPHVPDDLREEVLTQALDATHSIGDGDQRARALAALAPVLGEYPDVRIQLYRYWSEMLRTSSTYPRPRFLLVLATQAPLLVALGNAEVAAEAARAIVDGHRWWPGAENQPGQEVQAG